MRVAVITPYYKESTDTLVRCFESVLQQKIKADHFFISDGFPNLDIERVVKFHVTLPRAHADNGNTPRGIGGLIASKSGYDFIAYLDADNWFLQGHLEASILKHFESGAPIITSFRTFYDQAGNRLPITEPAEDMLHHVDTSCFLVSRDAFKILPVWSQMPQRLGPICDRVFLACMKYHRYQFVSTKQRTVAFSSQYAYHFRLAGLTPPGSAKTSQEFDDALGFLRSTKGLNECIDRIGFWPLPYMNL